MKKLLPLITAVALSALAVYSAGAQSVCLNCIPYGTGGGLGFKAAAAAPNAVLVTNGSNVPSLAQTLPSAVLIPSVAQLPGYVTGVCTALSLPSTCGQVVYTNTPNLMLSGAYLYYAVDASAGQQSVSVLHDARASSFVQLPRYSSIDAAFVLGDSSRQEFGLRWLNVPNISSRWIKIDYFHGHPNGFVYSATGSAQQTLVRSPSNGVRLKCSTGSTINSTCTERGPYAYTTMGGNQVMQSFIVEDDVTSAQVFIGYYDTSTDTYATTNDQAGFSHDNGTVLPNSNWHGVATVGGTQTRCDTGLAPVSGSTVILVMAYVTSATAVGGVAGIDFFAGYTDTAPVYRCHINTAAVPTGAISYYNFIKNLAASDRIVYKSHSELLVVAQ